MTGGFTLPLFFSFPPTLPLTCVRLNIGSENRPYFKEDGHANTPCVHYTQHQHQLSIAPQSTPSSITQWFSYNSFSSLILFRCPTMLSALRVHYWPLQPMPLISCLLLNCCFFPSVFLSPFHLYTLFFMSCFFFLLASFLLYRWFFLYIGGRLRTQLELDFAFLRAPVAHQISWRIMWKSGFRLRRNTICRAFVLTFDPPNESNCNYWKL